MRNNKIVSHYWPMLALLFITSLMLYGCAEMPEVVEETRPQRPVIVAGPYILLDQQKSTEDIRFRSQIPEVAGIRISGEKKITRRYGSSTTEHVINIMPLLPDEGERKLEILLGDYKSAEVIVNRAGLGKQSRVGFISGIGLDAVNVSAVAQQLGARNLNSAIVLGGNLPHDAKLKSWDDLVFSPLRPLSEKSPLMLLPEDQLILPYEAGGGSSTPVYWSRDIGCVHLMFLDLDELKQPARRGKALSWLQQDLAANTQPWAVLSLSKPLFGATRIYARAIETLGTLLEAGGVDLVVSGGAKYYQRSMPVKSGDSSAVRYIVSGGLASSSNTLLGREYKAAASNEPHFAVLTASPMRLDWDVYSTDGTRRLDTLTVFTDGRSLQGESAIEKMDILTDALAALTLQREVLTVAREAARAVDNPADPGSLTFIIANPSPRDISGELIWNMAADTAYKVDPPAVRFDLKSGFEGVVNFKVTAYAKDPAAPMPVMTVNMKGVGSASQQLIISKRKYDEVYPATGQIVIDGIMAEDTWQKARKLEGFGVIGTGVKPKLPIDARVTYDAKGIYVVARCAAKDPETIATTAKNHDDPIFRDESVEIFIDPYNRGREYFQFAVNVKGVTLDRSSRLGLSWNPQWDVKVTTRKDFYTVEAFIPYQALGIPNGPLPGQRWAFNLSRNDYQQSALHENPFTATDTHKPVLNKSKGVSRFNIAELAREDLGAEEVNKPVDKGNNEPGTEDKKGSGLEIIQWADTFGSNARSGLYGDLVFTNKQPVADTGKPSGK